MLRRVEMKTPFTPWRGCALSRFFRHISCSCLQLPVTRLCSSVRKKGVLFSGALSFLFFSRKEQKNAVMELLMKNERHKKKNHFASYILFHDCAQWLYSFVHHVLPSLSIKLGKQWSQAGSWGGKAGASNLHSLLPCSVMAGYHLRASAHPPL